jgi:hypothetical protein
LQCIQRIACRIVAPFPYLLHRLEYISIPGPKGDLAILVPASLGAPFWSYVYYNADNTRLSLQRTQRIALNV